MSRALWPLAVAVLLAACTRSSSDARDFLPSEPPYLRGTVTALGEARVRIEENAGEQSGSAKAELRLTPETRILWRTGEPANAGDMRLGARVSAWIDGPVRESYPVQGDAGTIVIESTTQPGEPGL